MEGGWGDTQQQHQASTLTGTHTCTRVHIRMPQYTQKFNKEKAK